MGADKDLPASSLVAVPGGRLLSRTAAAWNAACAAALHEDGVLLTIAQPDGTYRSWATSLDMRAHPAAHNINPSLNGLPGLPSDHQLGTEVDVEHGLSWMIANGHRFGFTRTKLAFNDKNHFHHDGVTVPAGSGSIALAAADPAAEQSRKDIDMIHYLITSTSTNGMIGKDQRFVQGADGILRCLGGGEWGFISTNHPDTTPVSIGGNELLDLITRVGLREYVADKGQPGGVGRLTGKIIYTAGEPRVYPKTTVA